MVNTIRFIDPEDRVGCPQSECDVDVESCMRCGRLAEVHLDGSQRYVRCGSYVMEASLDRAS